MRLRQLLCSVVILAVVILDGINKPNKQSMESGLLFCSWHHSLAAILWLVVPNSQFCGCVGLQSCDFSCAPLYKATESSPPVVEWVSNAVCTIKGIPLWFIILASLKSHLPFINCCIWTKLFLYGGGYLKWVDTTFKKQPLPLHNPENVKETKWKLKSP